MGNWSVVQIHNEALGLVGCQRIRSLDEAGVEAAACRFHWPLTLEYVLGVHPWKCLATQATLQTAATAPQFGHDYAWQLPADFVRMVSMRYADSAYHVTGKVLHCDESPAYIWYVPLVTDATRYDATLVQALAFVQAYKLALALRQDAKLADLLQGHFERFWLPVIRHADTSRRGVRTVESSTITDMFWR
jgi:hypothetical protein